MSSSKKKGARTLNHKYFLLSNDVIFKTRSLTIPLCSNLNSLVLLTYNFCNIFVTKSSLSTNYSIFNINVGSEDSHYLRILSFYLSYRRKKRKLNFCYRMLPYGVSRVNIESKTKTIFAIACLAKKLVFHTEICD